MSPDAQRILTKIREGKTRWHYDEMGMVLPLFEDEIVVPMRELRDEGYIEFTEVEKAVRGRVYVGGVLVSMVRDSSRGC